MPALLVANIGSTSFKFRLFEMPSERVLARGSIERIGSEECPFQFTVGEAAAVKGTASFPDHAAVLSLIHI